MPKYSTINIKALGKIPLNFTGIVGKVKFRVLKQMDIYGNVNAAIEDTNNGAYILSVDGKINADTLADTFAKYVYRQDDRMDISVTKKKIKPFFTQLNKDVKEENTKENKDKNILKNPYLVSKQKDYNKIIKRKTTSKKKTATRKTQTGSSNIAYDKRKQALAPGKRKSASGRIYYEYRANRSDAGKLLGTKTHKDSKSHNVNIRVISGIGNIGEKFTRINNDVNGNPRYVIHFLEFLNDEERINIPFTKKYEYAVKKAKLIGGKKYDNKNYGGGIVFQSYNIADTWSKIQELKNKQVKIKL